MKKAVFERRFAEIKAKTAVAGYMIKIINFAPCKISKLNDSFAVGKALKITIKTYPIIV